MEKFRKWVKDKRDKGIPATCGEAFNKLHELYPKQLPTNANIDEVYIYNH